MESSASNARYSNLLAHIRPEYGVPESFFAPGDSGECSCLFLVSCLNNETILYLEETFEPLTGYPQEMLLNKGLSFWFPLIHPEDMPSVTETIIKSHEDLATPGFPRPFPPIIIEYRFKQSTGEWKRIREIKYLLLSGDEIAIDKVLCKLELLEEKALQDEKNCSKLLDFAQAYHEKSPEETINTSKGAQHQPPSLPSLTKREMEILLLIGKGLSTKMIADKCNISINTVETHRRHLLEKLQVKNSMELIQKASKMFPFD